MAVSTLRGRHSFKQVFMHGNRQREGGLVLYWAPNGLARLRCGVAVKATVGRAVVRNRVRRWVRDLLRRWQKALKPGWDLIVLAVTPSVGDSYRSLAAQLNNALQRTGIVEGSLET